MLNVLNVSNVQTKRLDDITQLEDVDLLKIDVQGSELACFHGGAETLKKCCYH